MPIKIPVPDNSWSEVSVTLGGQTYELTFRYNERDEDDPHWRLDIYQSDEAIYVGLRIVPTILLLTDYRLDSFKHGDLVCLRMFKTGKLPVRDNLGIGKEYELVYYTAQELSELSS